VEFASALLEGGNQEIQDSFFNKLQSSDISQGFFKVFYDKMDEAQSEIKSTVTVNTTDITARAHDDNESAAKDIDKVVKKKGRK
jgi:inositol 1,4,5-triphosphate receptor type 1